MAKGRRPPPALAGCRVEQFAIRTRAIKFAGRTNLYIDGKELGAVPRLAICRGRDGIELIHCDRQWKVLGSSGVYASVREAKQRAERIYPGISRVWQKTGFTNRPVTRFLNQIGDNLKCSFCGKSWHEVQQMITAKTKKVAICDGCVREMSALISEDAG
jgi:hypothetical protein